MRITGTPEISTKKAAEHAEFLHVQRTLGMLAASDGSCPEAPSVKEYTRLFLEGYAAAHKPNEQDSKRQILDAHILPHFGDWPLDAIRQEHIDVFRAHLLDGRGRKTVNNILSVLSSIMKYAMTNEAIPHRRLTFTVKVDESELEAVPPEHVDALLARADARYQAGILLAHDAGMRIGEVRGFEWGDYNELKRTISIVRAVDSKDRVTATKNRKRRPVPVSERLRAALRGLPKSSPRVITRKDGEPISYWGLRDGIIDLYAAAGLETPPMPWHCLRHSFCTRLAERGVPVNVIRDLAGHQSIATTLRYIHTDDEARRGAIDSAFGQQVGNTAKSRKRKARKP